MIAPPRTAPSPPHTLSLHDALPIYEPAPRWTDRRGRSLFPLDLPDILVENGVFVPTQGSFLVWKYLFQEGIGSHGRCLDRKSTRLNSSHASTSYAVFCLKKKTRVGT